MSTRITRAFAPLVLLASLAAQRDVVRAAPGLSGVMAPEPAALASVAPAVPAPPRSVSDPDHRHPDRVIPVGPEHAIAQPATPPSADATEFTPLAGNFRYFTNRICRPTGANTSNNSSVEPSCAIVRDTVWQTGNWYAALSKDSGQTFSYVSPYTFFPAVDGGYCCDQRTEYVRSHDLVVWYMQNSFSATTGVGSIRVAVAYGRDRARSAVANDWTRYVFDPTEFGFPTGHWFDFPDVSSDDTWFYWTTNVFRRNANGTNTFISALCVRMELADMQAGTAVTFSSFRGDGANNGGGGSWRLANGGDGSAMFWGDTINTTTMRIWKWDAGGVSFVDRGIASFTSTTSSCVGPDGRDWLGNANGRIRGAWGQSSEIGFLWSSNAQAGRPNPYLRIARFRTSDRTLIIEDDVWSNTLCFAHGAADANSQGDVGIVVAIGSATAYVHTSATIVDSYQPWGTGFTFTSMGSGSAGPDSNSWGDYYDVQRNWLDQRTFVGTGHTMTSSTASTSRYAWFGRDDYEPTWVNVAINSTGVLGVPITVDVTDRNSLKDGSTNFTRTYTPRQGFALTAPATHSSGGATYAFERWAHQSTPTGSFVLQPIGQLTLAVDDCGTLDDVAEARYLVRRALTVQSTNPSNGVSITMSPADINGAQNGTMTFTRYYRHGETVTLTAPAVAGGNQFHRWVRGNLINTNLTVNVTLNSDETVVAEYWLYTPGTFVSYGTGCPGTGNAVPDHRAVGVPEIAQSVDYGVQHAVGNVPGVLLVGTRSTPIALGFLGMGTCTLDVFPIAVDVPLALDGLGRARLTVLYPDNVGLIGAQLGTQVSVVDFGTATPTKLVMSNAIETTLGGRR